MRLGVLATVLVAAGALGLTTTGCDDSESDAIDSDESAASAASDLAVAKDVLALLGGPNGKCNRCHTATAENVRAWGDAMRAIDRACFAPRNLDAKKRLECLRATPTTFSAKKLGLYAAGASLPQFQDVFKGSFRANEWTAKHADFERQAGMPKSGAPLTAAEFEKVKKWVLRGMPQLDKAAAAGQTGGAVCRATITPELVAHVSKMKTEGWGARLADQATPMFGCGGATSALACLATLPDLTATVGEPAVEQRIRKLRQFPLESHYWVRSSADGRYVGIGIAGAASKVLDLTQPTAAVRVAADYDPVFLPSNDGFGFAGVEADSQIHLCKQSLLADVARRPDPTLTLTEPKCSALGSQVYMSLGTSLDGARYFMTFGEHENDDGGNAVTAPLAGAFGEESETTFVPMVNDGAAYKAEAPVLVKTPKEGDAMLSPSSGLVAMRFENGFRVRMVKARRAGSTFAIDTPVGAEICMKGTKAGFSFDERFLVTHQYTDAADPEHRGLPKGSSNVVLVDLTNGKKVRVTKMGAGQYALYPHFRADGWLYFHVRDMNAQIEYVAATDVAVRLGAR